VELEDAYGDVARRRAAAVVYAQAHERGRVAGLERLGDDALADLLGIRRVPEHEPNPGAHDPVFEPEPERERDQRRAERALLALGERQAAALGIARAAGRTPQHAAPSACPACDTCPPPRQHR
jgi:hypothetical protein